MGRMGLNLYVSFQVPRCYRLGRCCWRLYIQVPRVKPLGPQSVGCESKNVILYIVEEGHDTFAT